MEQLLLIAIFLLVGIVNMLVRWLRQRAATRRPEVEMEPAPTPARVPDRLRGLPPGARVIPPELPLEAALAAARRMRPPPVSAPPPRRRPRRHRLLGSRADIRRAIVTMAVLGPCRAQERETDATAPASAPTRPAPER